MTSLGFLSHHPGDLLWFTQLLSGYDHKDPSSNIPKLNWSELPDNLNVYIISDPDFNGAYRSDLEIVTAIENVGNLPALQIPIAESEQTGLLIGCQVWAHPFQDHLALFVGNNIYNTFNAHKSGKT
jgi:Asp-tRNA(Asn)/Glu-tRNA(Gln) amidotransferase A subunit family amidase